MKKINLIFGSNGYVASNWKKKCKKKNVIFIGKNQCDLNKLTDIEKTLNNYKNYSISIFMLAAIVRKKKDTPYTAKKNIRMIKNIIKIIINFKLEYFFF